MAEHNPEQMEVAAAFGHAPNDVYGEPTQDKPAEKPQGFQEEVATVEELLGEIAPPEGADVAAVAVVDEEEAPPSDVDGLISRLQTIMDSEDASEEDKTSAEEMMARLEELKAAKQNAEEFLTEKEVAVVAPVEGDGAVIAVGEEVPAV